MRIVILSLMVALVTVTTLLAGCRATETVTETKTQTVVEERVVIE